MEIKIEIKQNQLNSNLQGKPCTYTLSIVIPSTLTANIRIICNIIK